MFKKDTRRGLALGAAFSLVASLFGAAPAALADETSVVVAPMVGTSNTMLITEDFVVKTRMGTGADSSKINNLKYYIEKPAGYNLSISHTVSATIAASAFINSTGNTSTQSAIAAGSTNSVVTPVGASTINVNQLRLQLWSTSMPTSLSAAVTVKVTAFLDVDPDGAFVATEPHQVYLVSFVPWSAMAASVTLTAGSVRGAVKASAIAAVSGVNVEQLDGEFNLQFRSTYGSGVTMSDDIKSFAVSGAMSASVPVSASAPVGASQSATLYYDVTNDNTFAPGETLVTSELAITEATVAGVTFSPVVGPNLTKTGAGASDARLSSTFNLKAWAFTGSTVVAAKVPTFTFTTSAVALSATKYVVVNGVTFTQSSIATNGSITLTAGADGKGDISVTTVGFASTDAITFNLSSENRAGSYVVTPRAVLFSVSSAVGAFAVSEAGQNVTANFVVVDQFGVAPSQNDQTVVFSIVGGAISTSTQSIAVVGGKASVTVTPKSAVATGSFTITPNLFYTDRAGVLIADNDSVIALTVFVQTVGSSNSFTVKPAQASYSASISYGVALSYSADITVKVALTGSAVVLSSPGLIIHSGLVSASDTLTVAAGSNGVVTFKATSRMAGTYTVSIIAGTATASTQVVVAAAAGNAGAAVSYDKSELVVGKTTAITGTLVDANGNPVATGPTASIVVAWTGGGLPFNVPSATDALGEFKFQVLVLSTEVGDAALAVTYRPNGAAVDTKNLSFATAIALVKTATVSSEQKVTIGTFTGFTAVFVKGYEGKKLSVKLAGKWSVVPSIMDSSAGYYLFKQKTGAGYVADVVVYIDGVEVERATVTTK
jgi:hypothetical protein